VAYIGIRQSSAAMEAGSKPMKQNGFENVYIYCLN